MQGKRLLVLTFFLLFFLAKTVFSNRSEALGGFSFAVPLYDGEFCFNPARLTLYSKPAFHFSHGWIFPGLNSNISSNYLSFKLPFANNRAIGMNYDQLGNPIYNRYRMGLYLGQILMLNPSVRFGFGAGLGLYGVSYDPSKGTYLSGRDNPNDPIFGSGKTRQDLGLDIGILGSIKDALYWGVGIRNIGRPNIGLESANPIPVETGFGVGLKYKDFILKGDIFFTSEAEKDVRIWSAGIEKSSLYKGFALRFGLTESSFRAGAGFNIPYLFGGLILDYSLTYYTGEIKKAGSTNHFVSVTAFLRQKKKAGVELKAVKIEKDCICAENLCMLKGVVRNDGDSTSWGVSCALRVKAESEPEYRLIYPLVYAEKIDPSEEETLLWVFSPKRVGKHKLVFSVDDDGTSFPKLSGKIDERDESDNICSTEVFVDTGFVVSIEHSIDTLFYDNVSVVNEEEPLVPAIFFEPDSAGFDKSYTRIIQEWVARLADNPDVRLLLLGFVDSLSESSKKELALARARAVKKLFEIYGGDDIAERVDISEAHDFLLPRIVVKDTQSLWKKEICAENRRVELKAIPAYTETLFVENIEDFTHLDEEFLRFVRSNEGVYIFVRAGGKTSIEALKKADRLRKNMVEKHPELDGRIRILPLQGLAGEIIVYADASGILYHPRRCETYVENADLSVVKLDTVRVYFSDISCVDSFSAKIVDRKGQAVKWFNMAPMMEKRFNIIWDFRDNWGLFVLPGTQYKLLLAAAFANRIVNFESPPVFVYSSSKVRLKRRMIFVQFRFDEVVPESDYLESRVEELAEQIISKQGVGGKFRLCGHTDIIGTESRNVELSLERARRELSLLYDFLALKLQLDEKSSVDDWLQKNQIKILIEGAGSSKPLSVYSLIERERRRINIGDNLTPYGRAVNRRVIVEWE